MTYLVYFFLALTSLLVTLVGLLLAPVLPLFAANEFGWSDNHSKLEFGPRLPSWLSWFMTPDNDLHGDATFVEINGKSYWSMVKWLIRNPAYSFGIRYLFSPFETTVSGDKTIKDNDGAKEGWCFVKGNGLFQFRYVKRIFNTNRCILVNLGWNIMALVDDNVQPKPSPYQATFVFSPRISGFR